MASAGPSSQIRRLTRQVFLALGIGTLSPLATADGLNTTLGFTPDYLNVEVAGANGDSPRQARLRSGLGLQLSNHLLDLLVDYRVQTQFTESSEKAAVSQKVGASLHSSALNDLLGIDAHIKAGSTFRDGGDAYVHSITPGVSKSLSELGKFSVQYVYRQDNAGGSAPEKEQQGYRLGLEGATLNGRLTWKGNYRSSDVRGVVEPLQRTELVEFESRYQLVPALQIRISGLSRDETLFEGRGGKDLRTESRYGIGLAWSPSPNYALAFKVNRLDESRENENEVIGSGSLSWFPERNMELTLSYGDDLVEGARGVMLSTKIDLSGS